MMEVIGHKNQVAEGNSSIFCKRVVAGLNRLAEVNQERNKEYLLALEETKDLNLKPVFQLYHVQSMEFINILSDRIKEHRGEYTHFLPKPQNKQKSWKGFRFIFSVPSPEDILSSCENCEAIAISTYKKVLALHHFPHETYVEISRQKDQIEKAFSQMISLSDYVN